MDYLKNIFQALNEELEDVKRRIRETLENADISDDEQNSSKQDFCSSSIILSTNKSRVKNHSLTQKRHNSIVQVLLQDFEGSVDTR